MQGGLVLDSICFVKYGVFFTIARLVFYTRIIFSDSFGNKCVFRMKLKSFLVGIFKIGIGLVKEFQLQSATNQILKSFLNTNTL